MLFWTHHHHIIVSQLLTVCEGQHAGHPALFIFNFIVTKPGAPVNVAVAVIVVVVLGSLASLSLLVGTLPNTPMSNVSRFVQRLVIIYRLKTH